MVPLPISCGPPWTPLCELQGGREVGGFALVFRFLRRDDDVIAPFLVVPTRHRSSPPG